MARQVEVLAGVRCNISKFQRGPSFSALSFDHDKPLVDREVAPIPYPDYRPLTSEPDAALSISVTFMTVCAYPHGNSRCLLLNLFSP